jgi:polyadenylation factor subunit 2
VKFYVFFINVAVAWHPIHENMFVSGSWEGAMNFWLVGDSNPKSVIESAHVTSVFALDWHPMGHILASGSNDHTTRFWTRNRPGDPMNDAMNLSKEEQKDLGIEVVEEEEEEVVELPGLGSNRPRPQSMGYGSRGGDRGGDRSGDRGDYGNRNDRGNDRGNTRGGDRGNDRSNDRGNDRGGYSRQGDQQNRYNQRDRDTRQKRW